MTKKHFKELAEHMAYLFKDLESQQDLTTSQVKDKIQGFILAFCRTQNVLFDDSRFISAVEKKYSELSK